MNVLQQQSKLFVFYLIQYWKKQNFIRFIWLWRTTSSKPDTENESDKSNLINLIHSWSDRVLPALRISWNSQENFVSEACYFNQKSLRHRFFLRILRNLWGKFLQSTSSRSLLSTHLISILWSLLIPHLSFTFLFLPIKHKNSCSVCATLTNFIDIRRITGILTLICRGNNRLEN